MKKVFQIPEPFRVPDGTLVSPFLNPKDSESLLPFDLLDGFSLAAGQIEAGSRSKIHILPFLTQVTFVRSGTLNVVMKDLNADEPYRLEVHTNEAVLTRPGTMLQLINHDIDLPCETLYIVSPAYVFLFDKTENRVIYDDSVILEENWDELRATAWQLSVKLPSREKREEAYQRLADSPSTSGHNTA